MSFLIGARKSKDDHMVERLGGAGSERVWLAILLAGYGVGSWPESRRARQWLCAPYLEGAAKLRAPNLPTEFNVTCSKEDLRKLIAYNADDCSWIDFRGSWRIYNSLDESLRRYNPKCAILTSLLDLYAQCIKRNGEGRINRFHVPALLSAYDAVSANLKESCWYQKIIAMRAVIAFAVRNRTDFTVG